MEEVVNLVCSHYDLDVHIYRDSQSQDASNARAIICYLVSKYIQPNKNRIAHQINKTRQMVYVYLKNIEIEKELAQKGIKQPLLIALEEIEKKYLEIR
jgi:hypothetical protein